MPYLTATYNPVYVWNPPGTGMTTITWATENNAIRGRVYVRADNAPAEALFDGNAANGSLNGSKALPVQFGRVYTLRLRRVSNNAVLATLIITVEEVTNLLVNMAIESMRLEQRLNPPQLIYNVSVRPFIETVRFSFATTQPTIPVITIETDGHHHGSIVAVGLLNGPQTKHSATFGLDTPLAQNRVHQFRIAASGTSSFGKNEAVVTGRFLTGTRMGTVFLDTLKVTKDADDWPNGAGDISFSFGCGDVNNEEPLGLVFSFTGDISDEDPPIHFNQANNFLQSRQGCGCRPMGSKATLHSPLAALM